MTTLDIYRGLSIISTINIDENTVLTKKLMNVDKITSTIISPKVLALEIGDFVTYNGANYYINQLPTLEKINENSHKYTIVFDGVLYELQNKILKSSDGLTEFSYTGSAQDFLTFIVNSINKISSGWAVGTVDDSQKKTLDFSNENCLSVLNIVATAFNFEFKLIGKTIDFKEAVGTVTNLSFEYGKNKGLYTLTRKSVESKSLITRLYAYGSTRNIPYSYRNRAKRLVFESRYLEKNTSIYGIREGVYTDEDMFPNRTAPLTGTNILFEGGVFNVDDSYIEDTTIDFNLNDYLAEGLTPKIVFKSGDLSGYEFEIWEFDWANKRIYFNPIQENDGFSLPSENLKPQTGDSYTIVDIKMPQGYIIQAENDLQDAAQKYLDANCVPKTLYIVKMDPKYVKANAITLDEGDLVTIIDAFLGIDSAIRINQISFPLVNPNKINAIIADFIPYTLQEQITRASIATNRTVNNIRNIVNNTSTTINNSSTTNTTIIEGNINKITVFDREFTWEKGFDNTNLETLQAGDFIMDNHYNRYTFVKKWQYLGADDLPQTKNDRANWDELETLDLTPAA